MIAVGAFMQETNDFSSLPTTVATFEERGVLRGPELARGKVATPELDAFLTEIPQWSAPSKGILPLAELRAWSQGRLTADTLAWGLSTLLDPLRDAVGGGTPIHGVLLALHGAMVADGDDDPEGTVLTTAREIVGPSVPIIATLDLHVHTTARMAAAADALVFYHQMPHVDMVETGQRAVRVMEAVLTRGARPATVFCKLPVHLPVERVNTLATQEQVAAGLFAAFPPHMRRVLADLEAEPWCLAAGLGTTQPWLNAPDLGATFVLVADRAVDGAVATAEAKVLELANELWDAREQFMPSGDSLLPADQAVRTAAEYARDHSKMVAIGDGADATTSGAPGDSTWLLQELLAHRWPAARPALVPVVSPEGVAEAADAGVGSSLTTSIGGRRDVRFAVPLKVNAIVESIFEGVFEVAAGHCKGLKCDMGKCATLRLLAEHGGEDTGVRVVLTSGTGPHFAAELFTLAGYPPFGPGEHVSVVVCKSPAGFRATYGPHAGLLLSSDAKGCAPPQFWKQEYRGEFSKTTTPLFPLDPLTVLSLDTQTFLSAASAPV